MLGAALALSTSIRLTLVGGELGGAAGINAILGGNVQILDAVIEAWDPAVNANNGVAASVTGGTLSGRVVVNGNREVDFAWRDPNLIRNR